MLIETRHFYRAMVCYVRPFVTRRYSVETTKRIMKLFGHQVDSFLKVFFSPNLITICRLRPHGGSNAGGYDKIAIFDECLALSRK